MDRNTENERPAKRVKRTEADGALTPTPTGNEDDDTEETGIVSDNGGAHGSDLYLDTVCITCLFVRAISNLRQVNRAALDFDFEKVCSVSLSNINVYGCLVCGKYFQGRGRNSYAYAHSIHDDHHVFINLETTKVRHTLLIGFGWM